MDSGSLNCEKGDAGALYSSFGFSWIDKGGCAAEEEGIPFAPCCGFPLSIGGGGALHEMAQAVSIYLTLTLRWYLERYHHYYCYSYY